MHLLKTALLACTLMAALPASAQEATLRKNLGERIQQLQKIEEVSKTPIPGLFEIRVNGSEIFYTDAEGNYLLQGSLIDRPKGSTMPTPADLRALIQASRAKAAEQTVQAIKRRQEVAEFWAWVDERMAETGETEDEILARFPSFRGTKPEAVHG